MSRQRHASVYALITRIHFYAGLFIGPFIFVAALSGLLYALAPQLEDWLYADQLTTASRGTEIPLAQQVESAVIHAGEGATLWAVRPAHSPGTTTRVMFSHPDLDISEHRGIFIDPVSGDVLGDLTVYGTTGVMPLRNWIGDLHRRVFLGDTGRLYSELAASWLWIVALGGFVLWLGRRRSPRRTGMTLRTGHSLLGLWLLIGLLFFSATGLTWSQWAGSNIGIARAAWGMSTPGLSTALEGERAEIGEHDHHHPVDSAAPDTGLDLSIFDRALASARAAGIDAGKLEIRPAQASNRAWTVTEIDRSWPTQVDAVAIDPATMAVVDRIEFAEFPLAAKLTRWGIDAHMGSLFGVANQLLLIVTAAGLLAMIIMGYLMWWRRQTSGASYQSPIVIWHRLPLLTRIIFASGLLLLGWSMPVLGASLLILILLDICVVMLRKRAATAR